MNRLEADVRTALADVGNEAPDTRRVSDRMVLRLKRVLKHVGLATEHAAAIEILKVFIEGFEEEAHQPHGTPACKEDRT